jgi:hypothetical protein
MRKTTRSADLVEETMPREDLLAAAATRAGGNGKYTYENELEFWKQAVTISKCQGQVLENWTHWFQNCFFFAPAKLWQSILPGWNFGSQVNVYKSSDPALEDGIVRHVASYGSQLGTMLDYLEVLRKQVQSKAPLGTKDDQAVEKLDKLIADIKLAKTIMATPK